MLIDDAAVQAGRPRVWQAAVGGEQLCRGDLMRSTPALARIGWLQYLPACRCSRLQAFPSSPLQPGRQAVHPQISVHAGPACHVFAGHWTA